MFQVTKIRIEELTIPELHKVKDAMQILTDLDIWEMDIDSRRFVTDLISKKEQTRI